MNWSRRDPIGSVAAMTAASSIAIILSAFPFTTALAHHGVSQYEMRETLTLEGVVEKWDWKSPHTWLTLAVSRNGASEIWEIEGAPPRWMSGQGWTPESLSAGETVSILFHPLRRGANGGILMEVERNNGEVLKVNRPARLGGP